jgi:uncharacterized membrane protein YkvA (DUF1232 family)
MRGWLKILLYLLGLVYVVSPYDALPDFIPEWGRPTTPLSWL